MESRPSVCHLLALNFDFKCEGRDFVLMVKKKKCFTVNFNYFLCAAICYYALLKLCLWLELRRLFND